MIEKITLKNNNTGNIAYPYTLDELVLRTGGTNVKNTLDGLENNMTLLRNNVNDRLDDQEAAIGLLDGHEVIVVTDHTDQTEVPNPDTQKVYREYGVNSYSDYMCTDPTSTPPTWLKLAEYSIPTSAADITDENLSKTQEQVNEDNLQQHEDLKHLVDNRTTYGDDVTSLIGEWNNSYNSPTDALEYATFDMDKAGHNGTITLLKNSTSNYRPVISFESLENGKDYRLAFGVSMPAGISLNLLTANPASNDSTASVGQLTDIYGNNIVLQNGANYDVLIHKTLDWKLITFNHRDLTFGDGIDVTISNFAVKEVIYVNEPDEGPTSGSDKLVKSGGVKNALDTITENLNELDETTIKKSVLRENYHPVKNLINTNDLLWGYYTNTNNNTLTEHEDCVASNKIVFRDGVIYALQGIGAYGTNRIIVIGYFGSDDSCLGTKSINATLDDPSVLRGKCLYTHTNYPVGTAYCRVNLATHTSAPLDTTLCQIEEGNEYTEVVGYEEVVNFGFVSKQDLEEEEERAKESEQFASRGFYVDYEKAVSITSHNYNTSNIADSIILPITPDYNKVTCVGAVVSLYNFFSSADFVAANYIGANSLGVVEEGSKWCIITLRHDANPNGYSGVTINIERKTEELDEVKDLLTVRDYVKMTPDDVTPEYFLHTDGLRVSQNFDIYTYNVDETKSYVFSGAYSATTTIYMIVFCDANGDPVSSDTSVSFPTAYKGSYSQAVQFTNEPLTLPPDTAIIKLNVRRNKASSFNLSEANTGYYNLEQMQSDIDELKKGVVPQNQTKIMKVTKTGTDIFVRTHLSESNDIIIKIGERTYVGSDINSNFITFRQYWVGPNALSDENLMNSSYELRNIGDMISPIWLGCGPIYSGHGWCTPKLTATNHGLTDDDLGSIWEDENGCQFTIGNIDGNKINLLPIITEDISTGIQTFSWNYSSTYPTTLTHVSGATHTNQIVGDNKASRYDLPVQECQSRHFIADGVEMEDGVYYCDDLVVKEHILGYNVGKVTSWFPTPVYNGTAIEFDRSFIFKGSSVTVNCVTDFKYPISIDNVGIHGYRTYAPEMPKKKGNYHSYTLIPKAKKTVDSHRVDLPFNSDDGTTTAISIIRNATDLYDVNKIPERIIAYLKDDNDNYLVGMAGGGSLLHGITTNANRIAVTSNNGHVMKYGGSDSSVHNKCYVANCLANSLFNEGYVPDSYICEGTIYFSWFNPADNVGQVYWYKDGNDYIVYAHCQTEHDKLAINLPYFMEGLTVDSTIEKTDGAILLTNQVINGKLYVSYDTTDNDANYIVLKLN